MLFNRLKIVIAALLCLAADKSFAQYNNLYPCGECAVYDNNGNDLSGFIASNKKEVLYKGGKVNDFSDNGWGYLEIKTARIPSVSQQGILNHSDYINATLALYKTKDGAEATWWGRQCNTPKGPLVSEKVADKGPLGMDVVGYHEVTHGLEQKKFTIVDYNSADYNQLDYDVLLGNYLLIENGIVKDINDYKTIIAFYDTFVSKFTYLEDPLLANKSFITFFSVGKTKYMGYFNIVNSKLAGHLETVDIQYEKDKDMLVANTFKKLTGSTVYVYGDDIFGLEKAFLNYGRDNKAKLVRRKTNTDKKFNEFK